MHERLVLLCRAVAGPFYSLTGHDVIRYLNVSHKNFIQTRFANMTSQAKRVVPLLLIFLAVFYGCATPGPKEGDFLWPPPPEDPKILYLKSYRGEADFVKKGLFDILFGAPPAKGLAKPYAVFAVKGKVYITLSGNPSVMVVDEKEKKVDYIGVAGSGRLSLPLGVAVARNGMVFVSDGKLKRVYGYDADGHALKIAIGKQDELKNPVGLAINEEAKRLYVVDSHAHLVRAYSLDGTPLFQFGTRGSGKGEFNFPLNIAVDQRSGDLYIVDGGNFRVQVFDSDGKYLRNIGELGDRPGNFARPRGVAVDSEGHVYVSDAAFDNFQIFDGTGRLLLFVGSAGPDPGQFNLPAGVHIDEQDRLFIVDSLNGRVQSFQYIGEKWKERNQAEYNKLLLPPAAGRQQ